MKKVKFTLGLALMMLFLGANISNAAMDPSRPIETSSAYIRVSLAVSPSLFYANSRDSVFRYGGDNDAISFHSARIGKYNLAGSYLGTTSWTNLQAPSVSGGGFVDINRASITLTGSSTPQSISSVTYATLDQCLKDGDSFEQVFKVKLKYVNGNANEPVFKRRIRVGDWFVRTDARVNRLEGTSIYFEERLYPDTILYKTDFTYGNDTAIYVFRSSILPYYTQYPVFSIDYTVSVEDIITGHEPGPGAGNVYLTRAMTVNADDGITTSYISGMPTRISSGTDFEFDVTGAAGKELKVTTNQPLWSVEKGSVVITRNGAGKWKVKLIKVRADMVINISYESALESGVSNNTFTEDKVWGSGGTLYVNTAKAGTLSIYSVTGQLCKTVTVSGSYTATMPKGLYIVQLNGKAYKVVL